MSLGKFATAVGRPCKGLTHYRAPIPFELVKGDEHFGHGHDKVNEVIS